ncbi:MAG: hypothetical protein HRU20_00875 [Pseudomonadales bacterium]|nr:hypothetical protein [Pseudomonadales bacterium]
MEPQTKAIVASLDEVTLKNAYKSILDSRDPSNIDFCILPGKKKKKAGDYTFLIVNDPAIAKILRGDGDIQVDILEDELLSRNNSGRRMDQKKFNSR